ncbi:hypothetical protein [Fervidibacter sp.]
MTQRYVVEAIVVSHDPQRWNFSESTDLSEILLVARKVQSENAGQVQNRRKRLKSHNPCLIDDAENNPSERTICINLWQNPRNPIDAFFVAEPIRKQEVPYLERGVLHIWVGREKFGEAFALDWDEFCSLDHWLLPFAYAQSNLVRMLLTLPTQNKLHLCPLRELGELGPDRRGVWSTFVPVDAPPGYPGFWGHDAQKVTTMSQKPNAYLLPSNVQRAQLLWSRSGRILIAERMRLNTQRLTSLLLAEPVLSNVWWPFKLRDKLGEDAEKILVLWFNSTMGIFLFVASRVETQGAWVSFKQQRLYAMPVLDVRKLTKRQRQKLVQAFDQLADKPLKPLSQLADDPVRKAIDDAISNALGLPDLTSLRVALCREPVLTLKPLRQRRM